MYISIHISQLMDWIKQLLNNALKLNNWNELEWLIGKLYYEKFTYWIDFSLRLQKTDFLIFLLYTWKISNVKHQIFQKHQSITQ